MLSYGIIWCQKRRVEVDYTKWLGPEWKFDPKTSYEGAGTYVANHQSFADILI
jgi:1-acyl-sn-glycerol-3-phosphate acyltransferase